MYSKSTSISFDFDVQPFHGIYTVEFTKFLGRFITAWRRGNSNERG